MTEKMTDKTKLAVIQKDLEYIKINVKDIRDKMEKEYVSRAEFEPIRNIVYGMVTLVLTGVVGALLTLVLRK
jgi:hypothetical protein